MSFYKKRMAARTVAQLRLKSTPRQRGGSQDKVAQINEAVLLQGARDGVPNSARSEPKIVQFSRHQWGIGRTN